MRTILLFASVAAVGCSVDIREIAGRACDSDHPCLESRQCVAGFCVDPIVGGNTPPPSTGENPPLPVVTTCGADAGPCSVGVGECQRTGQWTCLEGNVVCSVSAGTPSPELCTDDKDNDCDGRVNVSREVALATSPGTFDRLSWVAASDGGYLAVYEGVRNNVRRVYSRRFDAKLAPQGNEVTLSDANARTAKGPSVVLATNDDIYAVWSEESSGGTPRVQAARVDPNTGTIKNTARLSNENVVGAPRIAVGRGVGQNNPMYVLVMWIRSPNTLVGTTLAPDLTPVVATKAIGVAAAGDKVVDSSATYVRSNDFQVSWVTEDAGGFTVRTQRISEMLDPRDNEMVSFPSVNRPSNLRVFNNVGVDVGQEGETGIAWQEQTSNEFLLRASAAPRVSAVAVTAGAPVSATALSSDAVSTQRGPLVVFTEAQTGRMEARGLDGGVVLNLTPTGDAKPTGAPALARTKGTLAVGYATDGGLYGQIACEP